IAATDISRTGRSSQGPASITWHRGSRGSSSDSRDGGCSRHVGSTLYGLPSGRRAAATLRGAPAVSLLGGVPLFGYPIDGWIHESSIGEMSNRANAPTTIERTPPRAGRVDRLG